MRAILCLAAIALPLLVSCSSSPEAKQARFLETGKKYFLEKDYSRALLNFRNAAQARPKNPEPYYQQALTLLAMGDPQIAIGFLNRALELKPDHAGAKTTLASLMTTSRESGDIKHAETMLREVVAVNPNEEAAWNALGIAELRLGKLNDAETLLQQTVGKFPANLSSSVILAKVKASRGDISGAEEILKNTAARTPPSAPAITVLAQFLAQNGKLSDAQREFQKALSIDKTNSAALLGLAALHMRAGKQDKAAEYVRAAAQADKSVKSLYAEFLWSIGRKPEAVVELEHLFREDNKDRAIRTKLINAYVETGKQGSAEQLINSTIKKNPKDADALLQGAKLSLAAGKISEAQGLINRVFTFKSDSPEAHYLLAQIHGHRGAWLNQRQELNEVLKLKPDALPVRIELSRFLRETKANSAALEVLDQAPQAQKKTSAWIVEKNWIWIQLQDFAAAEKGIADGQAIASIPALTYQKGALRFTQNRFAEARAAAAEILKVQPENIEAMDLIGRSFIAEHQTAAALKKMREYGEALPKSAPVQMLVGRYESTYGEAPKARKAFETAKAANAQLTAADLAIAELDVRNHQFDRAIETVKKTLLTEPQNTNARMMLGQAELLAGQTEAAIQDFQRLVQEKPQYAPALNNLAFLLAERALDPDGALPYAQSAVELAPDVPAYQDTLGWVLFRKGLYSSAVPYLEKAVGADPTAVRQYHLAMAYQKAGRPVNARKSFEAGLKLNPDVPEALAAQKIVFSR